MKIVLGFILAFSIGVVCRILGIPLPAPPVLIGALVVLSMSVGYVVTDRYASHREVKHQHLSAGPTGAAVKPGDEI